MPARYTCAGANTSLPLRWSGVPAGTKELAVFIASNASGRSHTDWAVIGIKPTLHGLTAGKLPAGAVLGRNGDGKTSYSVCPAKHQSEQFAVGLFALSQRIGVKPGFSGLEVLNKVNKNSPLAVTIFSAKRP